jgi:hypothetical protein
MGDLKNTENIRQLPKFGNFVKKDHGKEHINITWKPF